MMSQAAGLEAVSCSWEKVTQHVALSGPVFILKADPV